MADFMSELWSSVFKPGATPTLLIATNVTFATLQVLLVTLLAATHSIHFVILSVLCGGLWWSINWFAQELKAAQAKEDEAERLRKKRKGEGDGRSRADVEDSADDEGEDTEVEDARTGRLGESTSSLDPGGEQRQTTAGSMAGTDGSGQGMKSAGLTTSVQQAMGSSSVRQRVVDEGDRSGEISTDSEWEKVSEHGDR